MRAFSICKNAPEKVNLSSLNVGSGKINEQQRQMDVKKGVKNTLKFTHQEPKLVHIFIIYD